MTCPKTAIGKYLGKTFKPVRLTAPWKKWLALVGKNSAYECSMFRITTIVHSQWLPSFNKYSLQVTTHLGDHTLVEHPIPFLLSILEDEVKSRASMSVDFPIDNDPKNEETLVTLDTRGMIPERWMLMLKDFYFKDSVAVDYHSEISSAEIESYWATVTSTISETIARNLIKRSIMMMHDPFRYFISVHQAPPYPVTVTDNTHAAQQEIITRAWITCDGVVSAPVNQFFKKSQSYLCLHGRGYSPLGAWEGGIAMWPAEIQPWRHILATYSRFQSMYIDTRGRSTYHNRKDLPMEEIIILEEMLKCEGAVVTHQIIRRG